VRLCLLLLVNPRRFLELETADRARRNTLPTQERAPDANIQIVRRAFLLSFLLVVASGLVGAAGAIVAASTVGCASSSVVTVLQVIGASLLLWGTLFIRGWEILSWSGVNYTERVNQWLYRFLYCAGTAVIVASLIWPTCAR
jgi:hypothetical protein